MGFSNCYVLGNQDEAVIIDPGIMDTNLLSTIEDNEFNLKGILITHDHPHHVRGLRTIMKIYNVEIYSVNPMIGEYRSFLVKGGDIVNAGSFRADVISIPGHSADSAVFKIGRLLFTGDSLSAGLTGSTTSSYAAATQVNALRSKLLSLPGDYIVLPGHGPPSSLEAERRFNLNVNSLARPKEPRPTLWVDL
jgi:glyoxylase-like metal-dependent hydrolase (beta-lactamase superfamily II)